MPNITPESTNPERPAGQDLSGPEFLYYTTEWQKLAQKLFILGRDKTDKYRTRPREVIKNPSVLLHHDDERVAELTGQFEKASSREELISSQNLYIDQPDYIIELQVWNEEHPFGLNENTERDVFYMGIHYKRQIPEELHDDTIYYVVCSTMKEAISIVMLDEYRQTNPKRAGEVTEILKGMVNDPGIINKILDPEEAKKELSRIDQLN